MTNTTKAFVLLPLLFGAQLAAQAQNLYVRQHTGIQNVYGISAVNSIKFSPGNVYIHKNTGIDSYALNAIRYINFTDLMVGIRSQNNGSDFKYSLYPNPAGNDLNITFPKNLETNGIVTVYTIDGKIALKQLIHRAGNTFKFNIANLHAGMYFCTVQVGDQTNTQKFIKH